MMTTGRMGRQNAARWRRTVDFVGGWMVERTRTNDAAAGRMARHGGGRADRSTWQGQEKKTQNYSSRGRLRLCGLPSFPDTDKTHTPHLLTEHERDQAEDGAEAEAQEPPGPPAGWRKERYGGMFFGNNGRTDGRTDGEFLTRILTRGGAGSRRRTTHRPPVTLGNEEWVRQCTSVTAGNTAS